MSDPTAQLGSSYSVPITGGDAKSSARAGEAFGGSISGDFIVGGGLRTKDLIIYGVVGFIAWQIMKKL